MTHSIPNYHPDWITDRLPTEADCDSDGEVRVPLTVQGAVSGPKCTYWCHYSVVVLGQPWWSEKAAANLANGVNSHPSPNRSKSMQLIKGIAGIPVLASTIIYLINAILATSVFGVVFNLIGFVFGILALAILWFPD
jgi:hypothetical protein